MFKEESKQEIAANRERARQPIKMVNPDKDLEVNMVSFLTNKAALSHHLNKAQRYNLFT